MKKKQGSRKETRKGRCTEGVKRMEGREGRV